MPDDVPDYRQPFPDEGHEAIRRPLAEALDELTAQVERVDDVFLLLLTTTDFAQSTLRTVLAAQAVMGETQETLAHLKGAAGGAAALARRVDDLIARVEALEAAGTGSEPAPGPVPDLPLLP